MIHNKFRYILTLVALFAISTGAWAQEEVLLTTVTATGHTTYSQSPDGIVTVTLDNIDSYHYTYGWLNSGSVTVEAAQGYTITRCVFKQNPNSTPNRVLVDDQAPFTATMVEVNNGEYYNVYAATSHGEAIGDDFMNGISTIEVYGTAAPSGPEVTWNKTTKQATFTMPAGDVELIPEYYPGMLTLGNAIEGGKLEVVGMGLGTTSFTAPSGWNQNSTKLASSHFEGFKGVTEEEAKAWSGVPATGMVALFYNYDETAQKWDFIYFKDGAFYKIYKGEPQQLATIYNLLDANFSVFYTTGMQVPAGFEKDEEGNIYVADKTEFKVKATPAEGYRLVSLMFGETDVTDKVDADGIATVTMPEGENDITLTATFSDEYDLAFQAANANTIEAGKATVKVGDAAATVTEGKLQGVKYGQTVTLNAKQGYKFRKVEAKKGAAAAPAKPEYADNAEELPANTKLYMRADLVYNGDWTWSPTYTAEQAQEVANYYAAITGTKCAVIYGHGAETDIYYVTSDNGVSGTVYRSNNLTDKFPGYKVYLLK